jgi:hypothetical protein
MRFRQDFYFGQLSHKIILLMLSPSEALATASNELLIVAWDPSYMAWYRLLYSNAPQQARLFAENQTDAMVNFSFFSEQKYVRSKSLAPFLESNLRRETRKVSCIAFSLSVLSGGCNFRYQQLLWPLCESTVWRIWPVANHRRFQLDSIGSTSTSE